MLPHRGGRCRSNFYAKSDPVSPSTDVITPSVWQRRPLSDNFKVTHMTWMEFEPRILKAWGRHLNL